MIGTTKMKTMRAERAPSTFVSKNYSEKKPAQIRNEFSQKSSTFRAKSPVKSKLNSMRAPSTPQSVRSLPRSRPAFSKKPNTNIPTQSPVRVSQRGATKSPVPNKFTRPTSVASSQRDAVSDFT